MASPVRLLGERLMLDLDRLTLGRRDFILGYIVPIVITRRPPKPPPPKKKTLVGFGNSPFGNTAWGN